MSIVPCIIFYQVHETIGRNTRQAIRIKSLIDRLFVYLFIYYFQLWNKSGRFSISIVFGRHVLRYGLVNDIVYR
jgi:hypothetical protein